MRRQSTQPRVAKGHEKGLSLMPMERYDPDERFSVDSTPEEVLRTLLDAEDEDEPEDDS